MFVRYGPITAVDGLTATISTGVTGLLGPNGAGKSSLLRVVATTQTPSAGHVDLCGVAITDRSRLREARRLVGYLPQHPGGYPGATARAFLEHIAVLKELTERRARAIEVARVLQLVGLEEKASVRLKHLSGGMRQRVALGCALLGDPPVVILDEPTVGLDPEQRMHFRELVAAIGRDHLVVLSTHQTDDIASLCTDVLVIRAGAAVFQGTPASLALVARGHVWLSREKEPGAIGGWATADGGFRNIGSPPVGADLLTPSVDDGYMVLLAGNRERSAS